MDPRILPPRDLDGDGDLDIAIVAGHDARSAYSVFSLENRSNAIDAARFRRGDVDASGLVDITDPIFLLQFLFQGGEPPGCHDAADTDDDQHLAITDAIRILSYLFQGGEPPVAPGPEACGPDSTPGDPCWPRCLYDPSRC
jgi:hypothetical protein